MDWRNKGRHVHNMKRHQAAHKKGVPAKASSAVSKADARTKSGVLKRSPRESKKTTIGKAHWSSKRTAGRSYSTHGRR